MSGPLCNATAPLWKVTSELQPRLSRGFLLERRQFVTIREEPYRRLARDFHLMARDLPPGEHRSALLEMAQEWDRLADQQEQRRRAG
jgi:hypothetical protein